MNDLDTLLRAADPAAETRDFTDAERRAILTSALTPQQAPKRRLGWRIGAVAAAALTAIGLGIGNLGGSSAEARADEVLTEAAINAVDPPSRPDQYWEVTAARDYGTDGCAMSDEIYYLSVSGDQPTWYLSRDTSPAACPGEPEASYTWTLPKSPNEMVDSWRWPSPAFLASLPRDVDQLRERLYQDAEGGAVSGRDVGVFLLVGYALTYGAPTADLRAAFFEVLKTVPGITVTDEMEVDGRTVAVFGIRGEDVTEMIVIDPEAGDLVGFQGVESQRKVTYTRELVDSVPEEVRAAASVLNCEVGFAEGIDPAGDLVCDG